MSNKQFQPISFEEWINRVNPGKVDEVDCPDCDGAGEQECQCACGHEHTKPCDNCNETGKVSSLKRLYQTQLQADRKKWEQYMNRKEQKL